jgi:uncharacterized circularly permuted ATP-grasp superfamily protein
MVAYDEMFGPDGGARGLAEAQGSRAVYAELQRWMGEATPEFFDARRRQAELFFRRIGITFAVYGEADASERLIPFDIVPRIISGHEWKKLEAGLIQRAKALNAYLGDIYGAGECVKAGIIPADLVYPNDQYRVEMTRIRPPHGVFVHINGTDLVRTGEDEFYVLEDNARTPSGVSYMLENREVMMRLFPELFARYRVAPVEIYTDTLLATLRSVAPNGLDGDPTAVVLTPGPFNSAFYEHSFLADKMGVELVEGTDLFVQDGRVFMRTTEGPRRVDVIYRRVDDDFIDPLAFRPDSVIGVPGLMSVYEAGRVTIVNAPGAGAADDKAVYSYMPEIIKFFSGEEPILKTVPTWRCREPDSLAYVLDHLPELVVKEVNGSGGYGMLVGPAATKAEVEAFRAKLTHDPDGFIAQPTLALSTCPTFVDQGLAPRHVDLRPFVLTGADGVRVTPGGLTRVALTKGSLVVNSSQGGGTKDTWVLDD